MEITGPGQPIPGLGNKPFGKEQSNPEGKPFSGRKIWKRIGTTGLKNELFEKQIDENTYILSGRHEIEDLNKKYDLGIPESDSFETLSGYILEHTGEIPEENEEFDVDDNSISKSTKPIPNRFKK